MAEQAKVPSIRFAGFTDPWEQRKLGELEKDATLYMGRGRVISAKDMSNTPGTFPVYSSSALDNGRMGAYGKYMFNQELITWSIDGGGAVFYRRKHRFSVTNVSGYIAVNPEKINCKFLAYAMSLAHSRIKFDYTVKAHPSVIRSLYTMGIPISLQEQQVIGSFFSRLDNLITLHQRKYDKLCVLKKSMLDKMFPKGGSLYPEIRFSGFTDPWEQRKLGEFGSVAMCKRIYKEQTSEQGDVPFFKIGTFGANPDAFISNELFEDFKCIYPYPTPGTLLISAAGSIGRVVEYQGEKAYFQDSNIVWLEHDHRLNDAFLKPLYSRIEWGLEGSTIKRLYNKDLLSAEVTVPGGREQKEIGQFFAKLDNLITLHQRKLELLRNIKKSMLDKMFV